MCVSLTCVLCTTAQSVETSFLFLGTVKNKSDSLMNHIKCITLFSLC